MGRRAALALIVAALAPLTASVVWASPQTGGRGTHPYPPVMGLELRGVVDPFVASYVESGIEAANRGTGTSAVLITMDTPGGLDSSMRQIVQAILRSDVPVICYTGPSGARAASAGTFIMLACPLNAMAPGTNIGAAHPVGVSGAIEQAKVTNDAAAFIESLAKRFNRNAEWAKRAVRESVSVSAEEAQRLNVVDLIAPSERALLDRANDEVITTGGGERVTVHAGGSAIHRRSLGLGAGLLHGLVNPNLAFLFFYLGLGLLIVELLHPGVSIPGVAGTLLLVTAFISFGLLPVQLGGIVLLVASAVFFLLELKHPGIGIPTAGGVACLILGGLLLFDPSVPGARVSPWLLGAVAAGAALFFGFLVRAALRARHLPVSSGLEGMVGEQGLALGDLDPRGLVRAQRETWSAESNAGPIPAGSAVRVVGLAGVRLIVSPAGAGAEERNRDGQVAGRLAAGSEGGVT